MTTGPGGINTLNGVHGAYTDSIGMVVLSGQVKRETLRHNAPVLVRQMGDQEAEAILQKAFPDGSRTGKAA